jgi:hypothetical protein
MKVKFTKQDRLFLLPTIMLEVWNKQVYFFFLHFRIIIEYERTRKH